MSLCDKRHGSEGWFGKLILWNAAAGEVKPEQDGGKRSVMEGGRGNKRMVQCVRELNEGWAT